MITSYPTTSLEHALSRQFGARLEDWSVRTLNRSFSSLEASRAETEPTSSGDTEQSIRTLFGKGPAVAPAIGDHPDFLHLRGSDDTCHCAIATMFMDIESSTRLSLMYPLDQVRVIKNAFIQTAIEIVRAFDGHVHRIMGDAVMAFFGGRNATNEEAIINAINCSAILQHFSEYIVIPRLRANGVSHDFGIRVGVDFGDYEKVLWGSYGFPEMEEVTATSFHVDIAAKLQHAAGRNQVMLGESLLKTIDFPRELVSLKTVQRQQESVSKPYVEPNHTDADGNTVDYEQRILLSDQYLLCTPLAQYSDGHLVGQNVGSLRINATVHEEFGSEEIGSYDAASRCLEKDQWLCFRPKFVATPPYTIRFHVENHGQEAMDDNGLTHEETYEVKTRDEHEQLLHWESTEYRGLHYQTIEVYVEGRIDRKVRFGVYVE